MVGSSNPVQFEARTVYYSPVEIDHRKKNPSNHKWVGIACTRPYSFNFELHCFLFARYFGFAYCMMAKRRLNSAVIVIVEVFIVQTTNIVCYMYSKACFGMNILVCTVKK